MPIQSKVKGIGGHAQATYKGTVQWKVQDDQRLIHHLPCLTCTMCQQHPHGSYAHNI